MTVVMVMIARRACLLGLIMAPLTQAANWTITRCTFTTTPAGMVFDTATNLTSSTTFTVACDATGSGTAATYTVGLSAGTSADTTQRTMKKGSSTLKYNLYKDSTHLSVWGDTASNWASQSVNTATSTRSLTIYGKIDNSSYQVAPAGTYADSSIIATITY